MNVTIVVFMLFSLVLGLWTKPRVRSGVLFLAGVALLMVLYFWFRPSQL